MDTYEKHILRDEAAVKVDVPDPMAIYRQALEDIPIAPIPDDYSAMKIAEIEAAERIREREELRPVESEIPVATAALVAEIRALRVAVEALAKIKN